MRIGTSLILAAGILLLGSLPVHAQISSGGQPASFGKAVRQSVDIHRTGPVDVDALLQEDRNTPKDIPFRFGTPFDVRLDMSNAGTWETLPDGSRLWRLRIESPGAHSINLLYDRFWLPHGAKLFIYNGDRSHVIGAFTSFNNKDYGQFATQPVRGDVSVIEYWEPAGINETPEFRISRIVHAYRNIFNRDVLKDALDFGQSGSCNNNVRCPEFAEFDQLIRSVAMITTGGGFRLCTGSMVNNTREDLTPYFLTANHCLGTPGSWVFMWNYESPNCNNIDGPTWMTVSGSTLRASSSFSDFALLELSAQPPDSYNVFYAGWNAYDTPSDSVIAVHHPSGDIKKISFDYDQVTATSYLGTSVPGDNSHWRIGQWEDGTTEPGSSGSPIFNRSGQVIGQLHGGYASCTSITSDWYGKVSQSWDHYSSSSQQLKYWLDPDNTGLLAIGGREGAGISITHEPLPDTPDSLNDYEVLADIVSNVALNPDSLLLYYQVASVWYEDTMVATGSADEHVGYIPAQSPGTVINYYLLGVDIEGKADTTDVFTFRVIDYGLTLEPAADTATGPVDDTVWYALRVTNAGVYADDYALTVAGNTWSTALYDDAELNPVSSSGLLNGGEFFDFKLRVIVPVSVYSESDEAVVTATSTGDPSFFATSAIVTVSDGQPVTIPFEDEFATTDLDLARWVENAGGEINDVGLNEPTEPYSLNLDGDPAGADTVLSQVIDLSGESNVILRYAWQRTGGGDSPESGDNLYVEYKDDLGAWQTLQEHLGSGDDMTEFLPVTLTLPAGAYHSGFRLRLRSTATAGTFDDWFVDDVYIGVPPAWDMSLNPALASQYGPAGDSVAYALQINNRGANDDSYTFTDSLGIWDISWWDASGTTQISSTGTVSSGDSISVVAKVAIPSGSLMNDIDSMYVRAVSTGDPDQTDQALLVSISAGPPGGFPWFEPFPAETLITPRWTLNTGAVVSTASINPPSPPYAVNLDGTVDTLVSQPIDLSGLSSVLLSYYYQRGGISEAPDDGDDLWIEYYNNGGSWVTVNQHPGSGSAMTTFAQVTFGLPADAYHGNFQIRVRNFGSGTGLDNWYVDNISVDYAPEISVEPASFAQTLDQGDSTTADLIVSNVGLGTLTYNLSMVPVAGKHSDVLARLLASGDLEPAWRTYPEDFENYEDPKGMDDPRTGFPVTKDAGGPDAYGYFWIDSDEPGGPAFDWIDVTATGTDVVADLNDDNFGGPYSIGFSFPFYDSVYSQIYIGSNGIVGFHPTDMQSRFKTQIPTAATPNAFLAWLWRDLNPDDADNPGAHVYIDNSGGQCVIQFVDYPEYGAAAGEVVNAEIILRPDGSIKFQYLSIAPGFDAAGSTVGIENPDGTDGLEVSYLTSYLKDSHAIEFIQPYQWLSLESYAGTLESGQADTVEVGFNSGELDEGTYQANIIVGSNDPANNPVTVPAAMTVTVPPQYICGDADGNEAGPNVEDLTFLVNYLFKGGPAPPEPEAADVDNSGALNVNDLTYLVNYLFKGGPPPDCGN